MSAIIDMSKIADIALVMVDASVGFEMETFEFLCLLKNHGFTSVMGVLTHMDEFRQNKSLNKLKKQIKKRFLKEVTDKAKLFYLYGIKNNLYMKMQMHTLARYLRVIKPGCPGFRQNHPYILADRFDVTFSKSTSDDPEDDVMVSFYGYVRGNNLNKNSTVHIMGLGDYKVDFAVSNEDPCPVETVEVKGKKKRTLKQKEKFLYAPYCNINSLEYDRNAGYITIPDKFVTFTKGIGETETQVHDEGVRIVRELQDMKKVKGIDKQIDEEGLEIFEGVEYKYDQEKTCIRAARSLDKIDDIEDYSEEEDYDQELNEIGKVSDDYSEFQLKSKPIYLKEDPTNNFIKSLYDYTSTEDEENDIEDCYRYNKAPEYDLNTLIKNAKKRFMAGNNFEENVEENSSEVEKEEEKELEKNPKNPKSLKNSDQAVFLNKSEEEQQAVLNKVKKEMQPFLSTEYGLFEKGNYIRLDIKKIKRKYVDHFKIDYPIILCTTNIQEESMGFLKIKFSKHIWHPKIMKTNDPLILSIGWRKFQTTPIYCVEDKNHRLRMIKYTPKYTSCFAVCYGPFMPINVSVVGLQNYVKEDKVAQFRICGTGDLIEVNQSFEVVKKLKLIGEPFEIYKKTAFIKGMFNSNVILI
jgi:ribosome biogenesis protein BMS1